MVGGSGQSLPTRSSTRPAACPVAKPRVLCACLQTHLALRRNANYELELEGELRAIFAVTSDPAQATLFFLPACPSIVFWETAARPDASEDILDGLTRGPSRNTYEAGLIEAMRRVGSWFDEQPERHLITRFNCQNRFDTLCRECLWLAVFMVHVSCIACVMYSSGTNECAHPAARSWSVLKQPHAFEFLCYLTQNTCY